MSHTRGSRSGFHHRLSLIAAFMAAVCMAIVAPTVAQKPPNILLILIDDVGPEHLAAYDLDGSDLEFANTEALDFWIVDWVQFEEAWATPICSPTRVAIQTGRFGFRTGVGALVTDDTYWGLDPDTDPYVLAKVLGEDTGEEDLEIPVAYTTVMFGKYHMGSSDGEGGEVPNQGGEQSPGVTAGFGDYKVHHTDLQVYPDLYDHYVISTPTQDSVEINTDVLGSAAYLTHATFQWFINWCTANDCRNQADSTTPWYAYIAPFAAHAPLHCPPTDLELYENIDCNETDNKSKYYAMIETLSLEIDRTLRYLTGGDVEDPENTLIIVAGDNGSPTFLSEQPFHAVRAKGTVAEGGVRVPLWIGGEDVTAFGEVQVENDHFVQLLDLYPTILEVAGLCDSEGCPSPIATDGVGLTPYFTSLNPTAVRDFAYAEWFYPNFNPDPFEPEGPAIGQWAVRNATHKWVKMTTGQAALYNLDEDPYEDTNLLPGSLDEGDEAAYNLLQDYFGSLGFASSETLLKFCDLEPVGAECINDGDCCSGMCVQDGQVLTCQLPEEFE